VSEQTPSGGWALVERQLGRAQETLVGARDEEQFQGVGLLCREALISLAQAVFNAERHKPLDGVQLSPTDSKRMLEAYVAVELGGESNEAARRHARSALDLANGLQHSRTADYAKAAMCLEATRSVVNVISVAAGRGDSRHTIAELCRRYVEEMNPGPSHRWILLRIAKEALGSAIASKFRESDLVDYCEWRLGVGVKPQTIRQDVTYLRLVFAKAYYEWDLDVPLHRFDEARRQVRLEGKIGEGNVRSRRPTSEEVERLVAHFKESRYALPMADIVEFALWSARPIAQIGSLRWDDVNVAKRTCIVRGIKSVRDKKGRDHEFPLHGEAWAIVQRQPRVTPYIFSMRTGNGTAQRIRAASASAAFTRAKKELAIPDLRLQDLRREAAIRLFKQGYTLEQVAQVTGHLNLNALAEHFRDASEGPS
jgi:integrase